MKTTRFLRSGRRIAAGLFVAAGLAASTQTASAALTLTAAGVSQGFTLTTFASGFPTFTFNGTTIGPVGIAFPTSGGVLVSDYSGNVRTFATDTDNQLASSAPVGQNFGVGNLDGMTTAAGVVYGTQQNNGNVVQLNNNGTFNQSIVGIAGATGIAANPTNGHLFVTSDTGGIFDVNPIAKTVVNFNNVMGDGIVFSPDGSIVYTAVSSTRVLGFDTTTKAQVFDSGVIAGNPDGVTLGTGAFANDLFVNTNSGTIVEVDRTTSAQTVIASGGTRGDFATADPNGTTLLTQTDSVVRLAQPAATGGSTVPLPPAVWSALATLAALACFAGVRRYKLA